MAEPEHVEPVRNEVIDAVPNLDLAQVLRWLPILEKLITAFNRGTGSFSTWTARGKRWVIVTDKEPAP